MLQRPHCKGIDLPHIWPTMRKCDAAYETTTTSSSITYHNAASRGGPNYGLE